MHSNDIEAFLNSLQEKKELYRASETDLKYCDDKTQDLLHKLELDALSYHERAAVAKELEAVRKNRRKAKDEIEQLTPVIAFMGNHEKYFNMLKQLLGEIRKIEQRQGARVYTPKAGD